MKSSVWIEEIYTHTSNYLNNYEDLKFPVVSKYITNRVNKIFGEMNKSIHIKDNSYDMAIPFASLLVLETILSVSNNEITPMDGNYIIEEIYKGLNEQ